MCFKMVKFIGTVMNRGDGLCDVGSDDGREAIIIYNKNSCICEFPQLRKMNILNLTFQKARIETIWNFQSKEASSVLGTTPYLLGDLEQVK